MWESCLSAGLENLSHLHPRRANEPQYEREGEQNVSLPPFRQLKMKRVRAAPMRCCRQDPVEINTPQ